MKRKYFERLIFFLSMQIFGLPLFAQGELNEQDNLFVTLPKIFVDRNKLHADGNKIDNIIDRLFLGTYYLTVSAESESESFEKETSHFHVQKRGEEIETEMKPIKVPMKEIFKAAEARSLEILQHRMFALAELEKEFRNLENKWHALNPGKNKDDWRKMDRKKVKLDCGPNSNPNQPFHCNLFHSWRYYVG